MEIMLQKMLVAGNKKIEQVQKDIHATGNPFVGFDNKLCKEDEYLLIYPNGDRIVSKPEGNQINEQLIFNL